LTGRRSFEVRKKRRGSFKVSEKSQRKNADFNRYIIFHELREDM
jgi:hypothetical protein